MGYYCDKMRAERGRVPLRYGIKYKLKTLFGWSLLLAGLLVRWLNMFPLVFQKLSPPYST